MVNTMEGDLHPTQTKQMDHSVFRETKQHYGQFSTSLQDIIKTKVSPLLNM